jgi:tRNA dimethylallyltransferase
MKQQQKSNSLPEVIHGNHKLLIICGPTASGKTALAVKLAKKLNGELISADSRQVYRGMDIVSGKDIPKESKLQINSEDNHVGYRVIKEIPIWLVDVVRPDQDFSVALFEKYARLVIKDIVKRGKLPILVGGTGLYIKSILSGVETANIPMNNKLRTKLYELTKENLQELLKKLNSKKYESMNNSDMNNPRRLIRAIEIEEYKKKNPKHSNTTQNDVNYDVLQIGLKAPKEILLERIKKRVDERIKDGAVNEVKRLMDLGYKPSLQSMSGDGYKELCKYINNEISWDDTVEKWIRSDFEHARKQMVWFKKDKKIVWIDITKSNFFLKCEKMTSKWYNMRYE